MSNAKTFYVYDSSTREVMYTINNPTLGQIESLRKRGILGHLDEPGISILNKVVIGDTAIVTVGEQFPSVVECKNDEQIKLIQDSKLSLTKRHKVVMKPSELDLDESITGYLNGEDGMIMVEVEDGNFKILNEQG